MAEKVATLDYTEISKAVTAATLRMNARYLRLDDLCVYLGCGRTYARRIAETAGAVRRLGAAWLCDRQALDKYLDGRDGELVDPETVKAWRAGKS